jgi:hypothetical protein
MLPISVALVILVIYVLFSVVFGALGDDLNIDIDVDADADLGGGSVLSAFLQLLNADKVPTMLVIAVLTLLMWVSGVASTKLFNPEHSLAIGLCLLVGCFVLCVIATRFAVMPLVPLFKMIKSGEDNGVRVEGMQGVVKSITLSDSFGQVELRGDDGPVLLNSRLREGEEPLNRGDKVVILERSEDGKFCYVSKLEI